MSHLDRLIEERDAAVAANNYPRVWELDAEIADEVAALMGKFNS